VFFVVSAFLWRWWFCVVCASDLRYEDYDFCDVGLTVIFAGPPDKPAYIGWVDVAVICDCDLCCGAARRSAYCVQLSGKNSSGYANKIESVGCRKCPYYHYLTKNVMSQ